MSDPNNFQQNKKGKMAVKSAKISRRNLSGMMRKASKDKRLQQKLGKAKSA